LELQKKIDADEATVTQITADNNNLKTQVEALNKELAGKGYTQQQHATEIQNLTDQNLKALKDQQTANDAKIAKLTAQIEENDSHIQEIIDNTNTQAKKLAKELLDCEAKEKDFQNQIQQLNTQITQLTEQNQMLTEKIKSATTAINESVARLNELTDDVANAKNMDDVKKLFQEINDTIDKINDTLKAGPGTSSPGTGTDASSVMSGMFAAVTGPAAPVAPVEPVAPIEQNTSSLANDTDINLYDISQKTQITKKLSDLRNELKAKSQAIIKQTGNRNNKYATALLAVNKATTADEVVNALKPSGVAVKNGVIFGGKKQRTRKGNKKGGYTYKNHKKSSSSYSSSSRGRRRGRSVKSVSM
jgi:hypothetical protein